MHLIQLEHKTAGRKVGIIEEPDILILAGLTSVYELFLETINMGHTLSSKIRSLRSAERISYDEVYHSKGVWRILPAIDATDPLYCVLSGTGLTHRASAENREKMHNQSEELTDSMKIYLWGEDGGKPPEGQIGVQPEWFYKGNGANLRGHGDILIVPNFGDDGGEEPEVAGVYLIDRWSNVHRVGYTQANEFSDHVMEKKNYLYLAPSKLRTCSIGPELVLNETFQSLHGEVKVNRGDKTLWEHRIQTGEEAMAHSLANLEYHHFKYPQHRIPGQLHIHFFGTGAFSFGAGIRLEEDDQMVVSFEAMGRPLINTLHIEQEAEKIPPIKSIS